MKLSTYFEDTTLASALQPDYHSATEDTVIIGRPRH